MSIIADYMVPADKVYMCQPKDTIASVLELMTTRRISAVVVQVEPLALVEKSHLLLAYSHQVPITQTIQELLHSQQIKTLYFTPTEARDFAFRVMEQKLCHHALVVNTTMQSGKHQFVGLVSAWDMATGQSSSWSTCGGGMMMIHTEPTPVTVVFPSVEDFGW